MKSDACFPNLFDNKGAGFLIEGNQPRIFIFDKTEISLLGTLVLQKEYQMI